MATRGIRAGLTALVLTGGLTLSGCGIVSIPLSGLGGSSPTPSAAPAQSAAPAESSVPLPDVFQAAGQCTNDFFSEQMLLSSVHVVSCDTSHYGETVHVGQFTGAAAGLAKPPTTDEAANAAAQSAAYLDCSSHADKYLGHSWIHMLLDLRVTVPMDQQWADGDRWYRCDLYEIDWDTYEVKARTASLKTNWFAPVCVNQNKDGWPIVSCSARHPGEFTGGYIGPANGKEPKTEAQYEPYHKKCRPINSKYLGLTGDRAMYIVGYSVFFQHDFDEWPTGRRVSFCFIWTGPKSSSYVTGSAKGKKGKGL